MSNIIIVGAGGAAGQSCLENMQDDNTLYLISRSEIDLSKINKKNSDNIYSSIININDYEKVAEFLKDITSQIDGIVFALGSITLKPFSNTSIDDFKNTMEDNFFNIVNFMHLAIPKMADNSSVVFFSSIAATKGFKNHATISAAKSALSGLSLALAADYAPKIRFNTISPSLSYSKMTNFITNNEKIAEGLSKMHPMSRLGNGSDLGSLASFLISKKSSWITGQNFNVDGGRSTLITK